ncbi:MAG: hypothetical protein KDB00_08790 [Planctomycetales bacterium]|nr:hypothetical protein [Planctomycetales bacterium]
MQHTQPEPPAVDLMELVRLFHSDESELGFFRACLTAEEIPQPRRELLNHEAHMTVTVEAHHGCPVDVRVARTVLGPGVDDPLGPQGSNLDIAATGRWYAREITLHRQSDQRPVQYGIVRLNIDALAPEVWHEIHSEKIPLGRVLISHQVLREVELCGLWEVVAGHSLASLLEMSVGEVTYGRTARIFCDYVPAIELLEIVTP